MNTKRVSDEEKYHFDTLGFLLIKNVLDDSEIEKLKKTFIKVKNNNDYNSKTVYLHKDLFKASFGKIFSVFL